MEIDFIGEKNKFTKKCQVDLIKVSRISMKTTSVTIVAKTY